MLQQFRHLFDHLIFGAGPGSACEPAESTIEPALVNRLPAEPATAVVKSVAILETPAESAKIEWIAARGATIPASPPVATPVRVPHGEALAPAVRELWEQEMCSARQQLAPEGALTGATRELQAGLGKFLQICHEHGVKVGPWRLHHVLGELTFGDHPTYGVLTIAHWVCKDSQPWKVGIGLFLGRGPGKPKDLEIKLATMDAEPRVVDHLILLRPEDDLSLSGKSKALWQEADRRGRHARLEPMNVESLAVLYGFARWLAALTEAQPEGQPLPNLADFLQERCERLLEQLCMPVQS